MNEPNFEALGQELLTRLTLTWERVSVSESFEPQEATVSLDDWRAQLASARLESIGKPGFYVDRSPTGAGKSHADFTALSQVDRALIVTATHQQAGEAEAALRQRGIAAAAYPARSTSDPANCWNEDADQAEQVGLSATAAVCRHCEFRMTCELTGYLASVAKARAAKVAVCTHQRAIRQGLANLTDDRAYVAIHEQPLNVLLPQVSVGPEEIKAARSVLDRLLNDPVWLDWFGGGAAEQQQSRLDELRDFVRHLDEIAQSIEADLVSASTTTQRDAPTARTRPGGIEELLWRATRESGVSQKPAWSALLSIATGEAFRMGVLVDEYQAPAEAADGRDAESTQELGNLLAF